METQLPIHEINGTSFLVDVQKGELKEAGNPDNTIAFADMRYNEEGYGFSYDPLTKNLPEWNRLYKPEIELIQVPHMVELDPAGMAAKYGKTLQEVSGKTDFEVIVDQEVLAMRMKGKLPTIDIAGHLFYVDIRCDRLRPKDDFSTMGISISEIEEYQYRDGDTYVFTYDPKTHRAREIDPEKMTTIPKDLLFIEIPIPKLLDPVGYARKTGCHVTELLMNTPLKELHQARTIPWKETGLLILIKENANKNRHQVKQSQKKRTGRSKRKGI
ncbi:MAG: hypothetical protein P0Y49_09405 [Candidatus Pedobacter colombiensis]|uniref:Uncharacterized protein n=1 Tax=Candidatus Pedobacter colombiensis TaxID=3121371 RepID=A0AAJ5WCZ6_9SPHI|nr:hypothetical protein [Pedobacter sp.]WEK21356.1 MAG: hypothetical protein P0Y49_09405 [Pedobacter sp.]